VLGVLIAVAFVTLRHAELRINFTESVPIGVYLLLPLPPDGAKRGVLVTACAPTDAEKLGRQRGYLAAGPCANNTELLLKSVAAIAGDEVDVTVSGVFVDGHLLPDSRSLSRDRSGRRLTTWPRGRRRLVSGQVWLYAAEDRSWDSRYWGPASVPDVKAEAVALLVLPRKGSARETMTFLSRQFLWRRPSRAAASEMVRLRKCAARCSTSNY
jgi:conjugative transfer signal peptidase TraF